MTVGAATFKSIVWIFVVLIILFGAKELILNFYPLLENNSPDADWWDFFIDKEIAKIIYPNDSIDALIAVFWGGGIGMVIGLVQNIIQTAKEVK